MKPISLTDLRHIVGGIPVAPLPDKPLHVQSVCTDSRQLSPGALFVAIQGETHDGHAFVPQAPAKGAVVAVVQTPPSGHIPNFPILQVADTRAALGKLARHVRQHFTGKVITVSGSNGKTGTKNLIDSVLNKRLRGSISPKSFNNDIGVPVTIFAADPTQQYLVLEVGTNHHGEIRTLTNIAQPDVAVITNISEEHLEGLGDLAGVRKEEASIIEGLRPDGMLIVNGDDTLLLDAIARYPGKKITFGFGEQNNIYATHVQCSRDGVRFKLNGRRDVFVPLLGKHIACNALAAIAVARRLGLTDDEIIKNLAEAHGPDMRLQLEEISGITLLNDAYNANPASTQAAIDTVCSLPTDGRRIAILGDMRELGAASEKLHREVGQYAAQHQDRIDHLICVGQQASLIAESAKQAGFPTPQITHFCDTESAAKALSSWFTPGDLVLLKASRGMRFEAIAKNITPTPERLAS